MSACFSKVLNLCLLSQSCPRAAEFKLSRDFIVCVGPRFPITSVDKHSLFFSWGSGAECYLSKEIGISFGGCFVHQRVLELRRGGGQGTVPLLPCANHPHRPFEVVASQLLGDWRVRRELGCLWHCSRKGSWNPLQKQGCCSLPACTGAEWQCFVSLFLLGAAKTFLNILKSFSQPSWRCSEIRAF